MQNKAPQAWLICPAFLKLIFFFLEQDVERGERAVAAGDVFLHLDLFGV